MARGKYSLPPRSLSDSSPVPYLRKEKDRVVLNVVVQARSSRTRVVGMHGDRLKIQITAPPVDGEANVMLISVLAELFGTPRQSVKLLRGQNGRAKTIRLCGISVADVVRRIEAALAKGTRNG